MAAANDRILELQAHCWTGIIVNKQVNNVRWRAHTALLNITVAMRTNNMLRNDSVIFRNSGKIIDNAMH